jgi:rhodanese-related sulfurtransferase
MVATAVNIPLNELRDRLDEIPKDKRILVYCQVGLRAYIACRILMQHGYDAYNLSGGYKTYEIVTGKQANEDIYQYDRVTLQDEIIKVKQE